MSVKMLIFLSVILENNIQCKCRKISKIVVEICIQTRRCCSCRQEDNRFCSKFKVLHTENEPLKGLDNIKKLLCPIRVKIEDKISKHIHFLL